MSPVSPPRIVIGAIAGDSGKTIVSLALVRLAREAGVEVRAFKKGPDFIDAAWLTWASGHPARNLDSFLMTYEQARCWFVQQAAAGGLNLIEGNRGLYDGVDAHGTHSTAQLAKMLRAPVVLVLNCAKQTRTAAACVLGCQKLDPDVRIAGVILNRVAGARHERILREAIESSCGIPVIGAVPKAGDRCALPERHLGLVTPDEHSEIERLEVWIGEVGSCLDFPRLMEIACEAGPLDSVRVLSRRSGLGSGLKAGYLRDAAFTFYYPENLEQLEAAGAGLVAIDAMASPALPEDLDLLYIGGGFPETQAKRLSKNTSFLRSLREAASRGLPIYAECGGLMLLSRSISFDGTCYPMAGALPFHVEMCGAPQGHGYSILRVDRPNPFFPPATILRGHEFHYSKVVTDGEPPPTACAVERGSGCFAGRDAVVTENIWAAYTHLHALATTDWAAALLTAARRFHCRRLPEAMLDGISRCELVRKHN